MWGLGGWPIIEYKLYLRGCTVELVDRCFPSSKLRSDCSQLHALTLADRELTCGCDLTIDSDLKAIINLTGTVGTGSG
ncbi:zinc ribbon domain-containing protein [Nitrosococcus oceani]|uniref:zinc ribbon domain-containing protein n=1 Tax=Nitrosococcus oceani TaxID=1229 RepID=UPI0009DD246E|nr:zinc ribbon domain-containing protein [Nitrosococcus oceani]